ncbi:MAG: phosphatidate cytidylyltransferase, partial [Gammaproteobacteria bacterium]|nr:phosphatidate cytidylyltransferase [Gammaproteobacteria bacterium]
MLKHRILTALILVPLVLGGIFYLPTQQLGYALVFFVVVGAWEWARIVGVHSPVARIIYAAFVGAILLALSFKPVEKELLLWLFAAVVLWWCVNFVRIAAYRGELGFRKTELGLDLFNGILLLIPTWLGFLFLHGHASKGIEQIVVLMLIIWGADTGAYFAGRCFGKHKLAPKVSPGKTWEGVAGASVVTIVVAIGSLYWLQIES